MEKDLDTESEASIVSEEELQPVKIKAYKYISGLPIVPMAFNGTKPVVASNSEKRRWLVDKAVLINGARPQPDDLIELPVTQLVFFPNSDKRRCTML